MMRYFYVILPVRSDRDYPQKRLNIELTSQSKHIRPMFPVDHPQPAPFEDMLNQIRNADFILADLSFQRPSCYYELGLAQACLKRTFIIAKKGTQVHQIEGEVVFYENLSDYTRLIARAIEQHEEESSHGFLTL